MKFMFFAFYLIVCSVAYAGDCVSLEQVKVGAASKVEEITKAIDEDTFIPVCTDEEQELQVLEDSDGAECLPKSSLIDSLSKFAWNDDKQTYTTTAFVWSCAAGADCWTIVEYSCDGKISAYTSGED